MHVEATDMTWLKCQGFYDPTNGYFRCINFFGAFNKVSFFDAISICLAECLVSAVYQVAYCCLYSFKMCCLLCKMILDAANKILSIKHIWFIYVFHHGWTKLKKCSYLAGHMT